MELTTDGNFIAKWGVDTTTLRVFKVGHSRSTS